MRVKGTMMMYVVRAIRGAGVDRFAAFVTEEDRRLLAQTILPINWYPFASYKRLFNALASGVARGSTQVLRQWGREYGSAILDGVYRSTIVHGSPYRSLKNYEKRFASFYDFGTLKVSQVGPGAADVVIREFDPEWEEIHQMILGWLEQTVKLAGADDARVELTARSWAGDAHTAYRVTWNAS